MADRDKLGAEGGVLREDGEKVDRMVGILADGFGGAAGGLAGTALMTVVFFVAESFGAFSRGSFASLGALAGLDSLLPAATAGFVLFLLGGMVPWPLLFASLEAYLPGRRRPVRGIFFGTALWTGFAPAFYDGYTGLALVLYIGLTLVAHWVYGVCLGLVFDYFARRPGSLV